MVQLAEHFGNDSRFANSEAARRRQWFIKARQENLRREELIDRADDAMLSTAVVVAQATAIQIAEFEARLDQYDQATIKALNQNRIRMDDVKARMAEIDLRLEDMLGRAHVMEDGRRVFLTEDRSRAFDETGIEVSADALDFDLVGPDNPTWESYSGTVEARQQARQELETLKAERQEIHEFQDKVDAARERVADGDITTDELDDLDAELAEAMPPSVKKHTPGFDTADNAPDLKSSFAAPANPVTLTKIGATIEAAPMLE